jgi:hypothetical protein
MKAKSKDKNTVEATVTMPVSVTYNGDEKKSNDVAVRRNGLRYRDHLTCSVLYVLCFMLFVLCFVGCGYTIHGKTSLPFDSIQIGKIENITVEPKLQDRLHETLTEEFLKQGIAVYPDAGYKLIGTINQFELRILSEKADVATEYEVLIKGDFKLIDPSGNIKEFKNIGSPFIVSFSGPGPLDELIASKELASEKAIRDMAMEIVAILIYPVRK